MSNGVSKAMTEANVIVWRFIPKDETVLNNGRRVWRPAPIIAVL